jgi:hypothetical protein
VKNAAAIDLNHEINQIGTESSKAAHGPFLVRAGQP